jgi:hypothetical protein
VPGKNLVTFGCGYIQAKPIVHERFLSRPIGRGASRGPPSRLGIQRAINRQNAGIIRNRHKLPSYVLARAVEYFLSRQLLPVAESREPKEEQQSEHRERY